MSAGFELTDPPRTGTVEAELSADGGVLSVRLTEAPEGLSPDEQQAIVDHLTALFAAIGQELIERQVQKAEVESPSPSSH